MSDRGMLEQIVSEPGVAHVRTLFLEYQTNIGVDLCFQNFASESLARLSRSYPSAHLFWHRTKRTCGGIATHKLRRYRCTSTTTSITIASVFCSNGLASGARGVRSARQQNLGTSNWCSRNVVGIPTVTLKRTYTFSPNRQRAAEYINRLTFLTLG